MAYRDEDWLEFHRQDAALAYDNAWSGYIVVDEEGVVRGYGDTADDAIAGAGGGDRVLELDWDVLFASGEMMRRLYADDTGQISWCLVGEMAALEDVLGEDDETFRTLADS